MQIKNDNIKNLNYNVELHPMGSKDKHTWATNYALWVNDDEVTKFLYQGTVPTSIEKCLSLYDLWTNNNHVVYNIFLNKRTQYWENIHIGVVGIYDIYWPSRVGEFRILLGAKDYWGIGIGKEALELMKVVAFEKLGLHKFWLGFNADHKRAEGAYVKVGFEHECVLKQHHYKNGKYNDLVRLCMFKEGYDKWKKENSKQD